MEPSASKGNNPILWAKLLDHVDERLQLGLLDRLRKISSYHFEGETLFLECATLEDEKYLKRDSIFQQLKIFAQDSTKVVEIKIKISEPS